MANELDWLRSKARHFETETMIVSEADAATAECEPGTYKIERYSFRGTIPVRMAKALSSARLTKTDDEHETLLLGNGYRSGQGQCEYFRTLYKRVAA